MLPFAMARPGAPACLAIGSGAGTLSKRTRSVPHLCHYFGEISDSFSNKTYSFNRRNSIPRCNVKPRKHGRNKLRNKHKQRDELIEVVRLCLRPRKVIAA